MRIKENQFRLMRMTDKEKDNKEISNICLMELGETSEIRSQTCNNFNELQKLLDHVLNNFCCILNELKEFKKKRKIGK